MSTEGGKEEHIYLLPLFELRSHSASPKHVAIFCPDASNLCGKVFILKSEAPGISRCILIYLQQSMAKLVIPDSSSVVIHAKDWNPDEVKMEKRYGTLIKVRHTQGETESLKCFVPWKTGFHMNILSE